MNTIDIKMINMIEDLLYNIFNRLEELSKDDIQVKRCLKMFSEYTIVSESINDILYAIFYPYCNNVSIANRYFNSKAHNWKNRKFFISFEHNSTAHKLNIKDKSKLKIFVIEIYFDHEHKLAYSRSDVNSKKKYRILDLFELLDIKINKSWRQRVERKLFEII